MEDCIVGDINKMKLDIQRNNEINSIDMMENTSVVYNMESVIQFQIFFLVSSIVYENMLIEMGLSNIKQRKPD